MRFSAMQKRSPRLSVLVLMPVVLGIFFLCQPRESCAVTPDLSLPKWHEVRAEISAWHPAARRLEIIVSIRAPLVDLSDLKVEPSWPDEFSPFPPKSLEPGRLLAGKTFVATFAATVPAPFAGWFELPIFARPETAGILSAIDRDSQRSAAQKLLLREDLKGLNAPVHIGLSLPLSISAEAAAFAPALFSFIPVVSGKETTLFLWPPTDRLGETRPAQDLARLHGLFQRGQWGKAAAEAARIEKSLADQGAMPLGGGRGEPSMQVSRRLVKAWLKATQATLEAISQGPAPLITLLKNIGEKDLGPGWPFVKASLGSLYRQAGKLDLAREAWREAVRAHPGWPRIRELLQQLGEVGK
jgi:hypothetical protein